MNKIDKTNRNIHFMLSIFLWFSTSFDLRGHRQEKKVFWPKNVRIFDHRGHCQEKMFFWKKKKHFSERF